MRFFLLASLFVASCFSKKHMRTHKHMTPLNQKPPGPAKCGRMQVPKGTYFDSWVDSKGRVRMRKAEDEHETIAIKMCDRDSDLSGCNAYMEIPEGLFVGQDKYWISDPERRLPILNFVSCEYGSENCAVMEIPEGTVVSLPNKVFKAGREHEPTFVRLEFCPHIVTMQDNYF